MKRVAAVFMVAVLLALTRAEAGEKTRIRVVYADSPATKEAGEFCRRFQRLFLEYSRGIPNLEELSKRWEVHCFETVDTGSKLPPVAITLTSKENLVRFPTIPRSELVDEPFSAAERAAKRVIKALLGKPKKGRR